MSNLTQAGNQLVHDLAQRHGVSTDAATHMLLAVYNGRGTMAQFSHPEFGGSGQWMRGGMTMVSDLFNNHLKARVDNICSDISNAISNHQLSPFTGSFQSQSQTAGTTQSQASGDISGANSNSLFAPDPDATWWPKELGTPNATGSQNNVRYAYFENARRLAVRTGPSDVWVYDTLDHRIGGFSQQQGNTTSIRFSSQYGTVDLPALPVVSRNGVESPRERAASDTSDAQTNTSASTYDPSPLASEQISLGMANLESNAQRGEVVNGGSNSTDVEASPSDRSSASILDTLERLGELQKKGFISEEEFMAKKAELLSRL